MASLISKEKTSCWNPNINCHNKNLVRLKLQIKLSLSFPFYIQNQIIGIKSQPKDESLGAASHMYIPHTLKSVVFEMIWKNMTNTVFDFGCLFTHAGYYWCRPKAAFLKTVGHKPMCIGVVSLYALDSKQCSLLLITVIPYWEVPETSFRLHSAMTHSIGLLQSQNAMQKRLEETSGSIYRQGLGNDSCLKPQIAAAHQCWQWWAKCIVWLRIKHLPIFKNLI